MRKLLLLLALLFPAYAHAAEADLYCLTGTSTTGAPIFQPASPTTPCPSGYPSVTYSPPTTGSVTTTKTIVAIPGSKVTQICNTTASGGGNIWLNPGGSTATTGAGQEATAGGGCITYSGAVLNANGNIITGVSDSGTATYTITTGS